MKNIYKAIMSCRDEEIIVMLDGDDQLENKDVLSFINNIYSTLDVWLTYGDFRCLYNNYSSWTQKFPELIINENTFRDWPHGLTHLRTFYAWLFKQIKIEDFFFEGDFFKMTYDVAMFAPMIELAAHHHHCIKEVLYGYNDQNPISDHKINMKLQHFLNRFIRQKSRYEPLIKTKCNEVDKLLSAKKLETDLIVFSDNAPRQLESLLTTLERHTTGIDIITIIYNANNQETENYYQSITFQHNQINLIRKPADHSEFRTIIENCLSRKNNNYIVLSYDNLALQFPIDLSHCIYWLEQTKAHGFYLSLGIDTFNKLENVCKGSSHQILSESLEQNIYNWESNYPITCQISLEDDDQRKVYAWQYASYYAQGLGRLIDFAIFRKKDLNFLNQITDMGCPKSMEGIWGNVLPQQKIGLFFSNAKVFFRG